MFWLELLRTIRKSMGRFIAIVLIVALGSGFYAGLRVTAPDMRLTMDGYMDEYQLMDIRVLSMLGLTDEDVEAVRAVAGVKSVMPAQFMDVVVAFSGKDEVIRVHSLPENTSAENDDYLNRVKLTEGRMPEKENECLMIAGSFFNGESAIGQQVTLTGEGTENLTHTEYTVVGSVETPYYVSFELGSADIGDGTLDGYMYIPESNFSTDYYTELYVMVEGAEQLLAFDEEYDAVVDKVQQRIESIADGRLEVRREEVLGDAEEQLEQARKEYANGKKELKDKLAEGEQKLEDGEKELENQRTQLAEAEQQIIDGKKQLEMGKAELEAARKALIEGRAQLETGKIAYEEGLLAYNTAKTETETALQEAQAQLLAGKATVLLQQQQLRLLLSQKNMAEANVSAIQGQLNELKTRLEQADEVTRPMLEAAILLREQELSTAKRAAETAASEYKTTKAEVDALSAQITAGEREYTTQKIKAETELQLAKQELDAAHEMLVANEAKLLEGETELTNGETELTKKSAELAEAEKQVKDGKTLLAEAEIELEKGRTELETQRAEAEQKLADAEQQIKDGEQAIETANNASWYVLDRHTNVGFASFEGDCDRMDALSQVFPVIFFAVAALVALTTMTRMVEEERGLIGTYCALGYSKRRIISKYLIYAGTATLGGSALGIFVLEKVLPMIVWTCYQLLYAGPPAEVPYNLTFSLIGLLVSAACTIGATYMACYQMVQERPARLLQPKAPKAGKRILLERIPFLWNRFSFTNKVTARNIFRYKKRLIMTVVGIAGCTSLLLTGYGIKDSISSLVQNQFSDLYQYDLQMTLGGELTPETEKILKNMPEVVEYMQFYQAAQEITHNDQTLSANVVVPESTERFGDYVVLRSRIGHAPVEFHAESVVLSEKLADKLGYRVGDPITIERPDGTHVELTVTGITEHYVMHYIYIAPELYQREVDELQPWNELMALCDTDQEIDYAAISERLTQQGEINTVVSTEVFGSQFESMIESLNLIIIVIIICAGLLAFVVLYNLTNINISERQREIATIRVLGFRNGETAMYIYRESILLTLIGCAVGLVLGVILHSFVITTIEVDMVMFARSVEPLSFVWATLLTLLFSGLVNIIMLRKITGVSMVESLKSVD